MFYQCRQKFNNNINIKIDRSLKKVINFLKLKKKLASLI